MNDLISVAKRVSNDYKSKNISTLSIVNALQNNVYPTFLTNNDISPITMAIRLDYNKEGLTFRYNVNVTLSTELVDRNICLSDKSMDLVKDKVKGIVTRRIEEGFYRANDGNKVDRRITSKTAPILHEKIMKFIDKKSDIPHYLKAYGAFHRLRDAVCQNLDFIENTGRFKGANVKSVKILMFHVYDYDSGAEHAIPAIYSNNSCILISANDAEKELYNKYKLTKIIPELLSSKCEIAEINSFNSTSPDTFNIVRALDIKQPEQNVLRYVITFASLFPNNIKNDLFKSTKDLIVANLLNNNQHFPIYENESVDAFVMTLSAIIQTIIINKQREDNGLRGYPYNIDTLNYI